MPERNSYSIFYLTEPDPRGSMGLGGKEEVLAAVEDTLFCFVLC